MYDRRSMAQWFDFLNELRPQSDGELTSLVTPHLQHFDADFAGSDLRVDWLVHVGGRIRSDLEGALLRTKAESSAAGSSTKSVLLRTEMRSDPVLRFELRSWIDAHPGQLLLESTGAKRSDDQSDWYEAMTLPNLLERTEFLRAMREADVDLNEPPWIFWSRFPPWLRRYGKNENELGPEIFHFDEAMTFRRVALSPQDERNELESLAPSMLMVNPTFETVETRGSKHSPVLGFSRDWDTVVVRPLTMIEAAVLDFVRESFRADRTKVLTVVAEETGTRKEFVSTAIETLISESFLLGQRSAGSTVRNQ